MARTFDEYMRTKVSPEMQAEVEFQASLIDKIIEARESKGLSQRELADISGVKQPAIARVESMKSTPQVDTLIKLLVPLGYTLDIVPLRKQSD